MEMTSPFKNSRGESDIPWFWIVVICGIAANWLGFCDDDKTIKETAETVIVETKEKIEKFNLKEIMPVMPQKKTKPEAVVDADSNIPVVEKKKESTDDPFGKTFGKTEDKYEREDKY